MPHMHVILRAAFACMLALTLWSCAVNGQSSREGDPPADGTILKAPAKAGAPGACVFDGVNVVPREAPVEGFQVRDVAAGSGFVRIDHEALGLKLEHKATNTPGGTFVDCTLSDTTGKDRAVTLVYAVPVDAAGLRWLEDPRRSVDVEAGKEYTNANRFPVGGGRLSRYPLAAVANDREGVGIGIDMSYPAFFRVSYNAATRELFIAWDIGLTPEKPSARLRLCTFRFEPKWGFRAALERYYALFPEQFRRRIADQGLWMPFARISRVKGWRDFGFRFKEGNNESDWDRAHGILTFRYTEPMTWWMKMPPEMSRDYDTALAEAKKRAAAGDARAQALLTSGFHDASGRFAVRFEDTPWCDGAVWSMNSMPGVAGEVTDFHNKWNAQVRERLYADGSTLDGEYIDSSEAWMTDMLDFRREHFAAADTPLTFSPDTHRPGIFKGLVSFEYVRGLARDVHSMGRYMMANGTPGRLCWLAPLLDVMGTETDWNRRGRWRPMSDADLLYRRALAKDKPYCFLMNTRFERFGPDLVEKYMKRSLAYGMFPGFFSANASGGQYFRRPELYDRDRPLFRKYVPLVKRLAEAGWQPIPLARTDARRVHVERFGPRLLTLFNDSPTPRTFTVTLDGLSASTARELLSGRDLELKDGKLSLTLQGEDVAVVELGEE